MPTPVSPTSLLMSDAFSAWDDALRFELFSERPQPTLSVPEQIAAELAQRILAGKPGPGERIAEQQVADEFKVSRGRCAKPSACWSAKAWPPCCRVAVLW
ncbi:MAG: GntR family transcriptional regulator [Betaproteobacteria bacterium]|nr:GntR family transcriptional regulator [Betaproteobacteria bacterium]